MGWFNKEKETAQKASASLKQDSSKDASAKPEVQSAVAPAEAARVSPWYRANSDGTYTCLHCYEEGSLTDKGFDPCKCGHCGVAIHISLQTDFTCDACKRKVELMEALSTIYQMKKQAIENNILWPTVIHLSSFLPAKIAASIESGTEIMDEARDCFCNSISLREQYEAMKSAGTFDPSQVEAFLTAMIQGSIQLGIQQKPEKNYFA